MDTNTRGRPAVSLLLTSVAFFMVALDALVVITALPAIHAQLGGSVATLEWTVNAYGLAFAAGIVTASALGDRLGRRRVYVAGLILFSAASAACALAPSAAPSCRGCPGTGSSGSTCRSGSPRRSRPPGCCRRATARRGGSTCPRCR